jgi:acetoacetyl-CoA synthetase
VKHIQRNQKEAEMKIERAKIVWTPDPVEARESQLGKFATEHGFGIDEYDALHRWSVARPGEFWSAVWDHAGLLGTKGDRTILDSPELGKRHFFPDGTINVAQNLLRHDPQSTAIIQMTSTGEVAYRLSFGELSEQVRRVAGWMAANGVKAGSVVGTVTGNRTEAAVAMLASAALGAMWTAASPDLSAQAIVDRFGQVAPVVIFASAQYAYNGKGYDISEMLNLAVEQIPSIKHVVLVGDNEAPAKLAFGRAHAVAWNDVRSHEPVSGFVQMPFNAPLLVMYTSGTTGKPKAIVHSGGGVLLRACSEQRFHIGMTGKDVFFWYSSIAWMMFPWLVLSLETGAAIVLYEDAAIKKTEGELDHGVLWRIAQNAKATALGVSPSYLRILQRAGFHPAKEYDCRALRAMFTSGAPMPAELYDWVHANVSPTLRINSISGGTEVLSAFVCGSPLHAVRAGEMGVKSLGFAVEVYDERGATVVGQPGELVVTQPFPSMPLTFWGPGGDERYKATYFEQFPGVWTHGDLAEQTVSGGFLIHGRSDNTLKPGGVRIGTAEIYTAIEAVAEVSDAVIFGQVENGEEQVILCVQMEAGHELSEALAMKLRTAIRSQTSPRHVPSKVVLVSDVPKTLNGKRNEAAARAAAHGKDTARFVSLANRSCLADYASISERPYF